MDKDQELLTAWDQAYSVPPGDRPPGTYIGNIEKGGRVYEFYKGSDGKYFYESHGKGERCR